MEENYYGILDVPPNASIKVIRSSYRKIAMETHPDLNPGNKKAEERFKKAAEAYEVLEDADKRRAYDARINSRSPSPAQTRKNNTSSDLFAGFHEALSAKRFFSSDPSAREWKNLIKEIIRMRDMDDKMTFDDLLSDYKKTQSRFVELLLVARIQKTPTCKQIYERTKAVLDATEGRRLTKCSNNLRKLFTMYAPEAYTEAIKRYEEEIPRKIERTIQGFLRKASRYFTNLQAG